jgi:glycosyltransferase involved in cell wall biosynthesis
VAGRAGGIPEVVEDGVSGILIEPHNVEQLVNALSELIENKEKRLSMGKEGQRICQEKFDYKIMAKRTEEIYLRK